jgi:putative heme-binding domain-containing protein
LLPFPKPEGGGELPPISELSQLAGDPAEGAAAYTKAGCITCHRINGQHTDFGPDLSEIGSKLSREAMFEAILFPSAAISHGFHGVVIKQKEGASVAGYLTSETASGLTIRLPGGVSQTIAADKIASRENMEQSLMPPGLAAALSTQELTDLVAYLQGLKK